MRVEAFAVGGREGISEQAHGLQTAILPAVLNQGAAQIVRPGPARFDELFLDLRKVVGRHGAGIGLDDEVDAGEDRILGNLGVEGGNGAVEGALENALEALAQSGVVPVARHVDQTGDEAFEGVLAHEERRPLPFLKMQDTQTDVVQLGLGGLEELIPREGLQRVQQRLAVVTRRIEAGPA